MATFTFKRVLGRCFVLRAIERDSNQIFKRIRLFLRVALLGFSRSITSRIRSHIESSHARIHLFRNTQDVMSSSDKIRRVGFFVRMRYIRFLQKLIVFSRHRSTPYWSFFPCTQVQHQTIDRSEIIA
jgi:hypothetical protein